MKKTLLALSFVVYGFSFLNAQTINTVAGIGTNGFSGDGGQATAAELNWPEYVAFDAAGNYYISDDQNFVIREVNTSGVISTIAGISGINGYSGDGGPATAAELNFPFGIAVDANGNIYIGDTFNNVVRKINTSGIISTFAGNGTSGFSGDGGQATAAELNQLMGVTLDANNNLFIADQGNSVIREVNTSGVITTAAGNGAFGFSGDGGPYYLAELNSPSAVAFDASGNMYIADEFNYVIRTVNTSGIINTYAGKHGVQGFAGDGGPATAAEFHNPFGLTFDATGNLFIADGGNNNIRIIDATHTINSYAGNSTQGYSGDGGPAALAELFNPTDVAFDGTGNLYIADAENFVVRQVSETATGVIPVNRNTKNVSISPNPSNGVFTIKVKSEESKVNSAIEIYNMLGEKVYSQISLPNTQYSIDISHQASGIYLYRVITETGSLVSTGKLVIE